jgi:hypothetical protein
MNVLNASGNPTVATTQSTAPSTFTNPFTNPVPFSKHKKGPNERPIRFRCFLQNTILEVLKNRGWQEVAEGGDDWDIYWVDVGSMKELFDHGYFEEQVRFNHFRNHYEVS